MKKILFLGAAPTQIPPITYALDQGHYVITCDYLPDNPGHRLAHECHNISTTDQRKVLELSRKLDIDAVVAYALTRSPNRCLCSRTTRLAWQSI